jgi:rubrerythrin
MKRSLVLLAVLLVAAVPFKVRQVLEKSLANEREAVARYEAFAQTAEAEGYPGAASLFRACARAEGVHAERFAAAMKERGLEVPEAALPAPSIGSTAENLRGAALAEQAERDSVYKDALSAAHDAKDAALVTVFDQTRDTEVEHANLLTSALRQLDSFKSAKTFYVCDKCGYTSDFEMGMCPLCRVNRHPHEVN